MNDLSKIKIGFSPLSKGLFIYRHGKDPQLALDKREAQADVMAAVIEFMMHDAPTGASQVVRFGDKEFEITVKPLQPLCAQCKNNARYNDAGGYHDLAQKCREYCRRGHKEKSQ